MALDPIRLRPIPNYGPMPIGQELINPNLFAAPTGWTAPQTAAEMLAGLAPGLAPGPSVRLAPTNVVQGFGVPLVGQPPASQPPAASNAASPRAAASNPAFSRLPTSTARTGGMGYPKVSGAASGAQKLAQSLAGSADDLAPLGDVQGPLLQEVQNPLKAGLSRAGAKAGAGGQGWLKTAFGLSDEAGSMAGGLKAGGWKGLLSSPAAKGVGAGLALQYAGNMVDAANIGGEDSQLDRTLGNAGKGAAIGAGLGSIVPGVGTGLGALGGGAIGAVSGLFSGEDPGKRTDDAAKRNRQALASALAGVDPEIATYLNQQLDAAIAAPPLYDANGNVVGRAPEGPQAAKTIDAITAQLVNLVPQMAEQKRLEDQATQDQLAQQLSAQALVGSVMKPYLDQVNQQAELQAHQYEQAAASTGDPTMQQSYLQRAAQTRSSAANMAFALGMQGMYGPQNEQFSAAYENQQALANQIAQQVQQQGISNMLGGVTAGNSVDEVLAAP